MADPILISEGVRPDPARLVAQAFLPGTDPVAKDLGRLGLIVDRILGLDPEERDRLLDDVRGRTATRFDDIEATWLEHCRRAEAMVPALDLVDDTETRLLVGAYLTRGYAYEAAALTNPSIVPYGPPVDGNQPFVMSGRAIGEGHISSVTFITGTVDGDGGVSLEPRHPHASNGKRQYLPMETEHFARLLAELNLEGAVTRRVISSLGERFDADQLDHALSMLAESDVDAAELPDMLRHLHWLASSNYLVGFDPSLPISEHLLSPAVPIESHGIEDARFVRFQDEKGPVVYYATYTAYDGTRILPQLIETTDFHDFEMSTISGPAVQHKGMAIFPRKVAGEYLALSRHDHERIFLMSSDDIHSWGNAEVVVWPERSWETIQIGNCGSPLETEAGWLVLTHGVGTMRRYVMGAVLLDLDEPSKLLGRTREPILEPGENESFGYVPDVVYSCGSMLHNGLLVIPYGFADFGIKFAVTPVDSILDQMS